MNSTKPLLTWNDYLETGIDIIDQQHRGLVDLANETAAKLTAGDGLSSDEMRVLLGFLTDYAATHFSTEEALMALSGIDQQHVMHHRQSHTTFLEQVNAMVDDLAGGELSGLQLMDFLGNWLIYHMLGEDQKLSRLLRNEPDGPETPVAEPELAGQQAANHSLAGLYAFMAERNQQLQATEQVQRSRSNQMAELVAAQTTELAASEERFRALFQNGVLPIIIMRLEVDLIPGPIVDANPAACRLLGYTPPELLGRSPLDLVAPDEIARFPLLLAELQVTGRFACEMGLVDKDGRHLPSQLSIAQFVMHGQPVAMAIIQEIPTQRAAELARDDIRQQSRHLAEIRSGFLSGTGQPAGLRPAGASLADTPATPSEAIGPARIAAMLAEHILFKDVTRHERAKLAAASCGRPLHKGEILFAKGERPTALYLVASGQILLAVSAQGGKKVLGLFADGQSIGEAEVVMDSPYPYYAEAVDEAEVLEIGQTALLALLDKDKGFARRLLHCLGTRQHDLVYSVESYSLRTGAERVIGYLLQHATIQAGGRLTVALPATKQLIASLLNIKPETLSRILRDLDEAGLIESRSRHINIPDIDRLIAYQA